MLAYIRDICLVILCKREFRGFGLYGNGTDRHKAVRQAVVVQAENYAEALCGERQLIVAVLNLAALEKPGVELRVYAAFFGRTETGACAPNCAIFQFETYLRGLNKDFSVILQGPGEPGTGFYGSLEAAVRGRNRNRLCSRCYHSHK